MGMDSNTDTTTLIVRPMKRRWDLGLGVLRQLKEIGISKSLRARAEYDSATKTWTLTMSSRELASLVAGGAPLWEALERWGLEQVR